MFRSSGNVVSAGLLFVLAVVMFTATFQFPPPGQPYDPGTAAFPRILVIGLGILAILQLFSSGETQSLPRGRSALRVAGAVSLMLAYALLLETLGFLASTFLFLISLVLMTGTRNLVALVLLPAGVSLVLFYVFNQLLSVSLPRGLLEGILF